MRPLALTFPNNSWSFLSMLITAFLKDQGRSSCHPVHTGAGQGSLTQHSAISAENSIINLNIIATIFKGTNMKGSWIKAPVPFVARSFHCLDVEKHGSTDLHSEVLSALRSGWFYLVLPLRGNTTSFDLNHSVSRLIRLLTGAVVFL